MFSDNKLYSKHPIMLQIHPYISVSFVNNRTSITRQVFLPQVIDCNGGATSQVIFILRTSFQDDGQP